MKKQSIVMLVLVAVCFCAFKCQAVSLRRDGDNLRESLLKEKPIGTPIKVIEAWVKTKDWTEIDVSYTKGYFRNQPRHEATVGVKSITATLGRYVSFPVGFTTTVVANWGFNEKGELIDVWIEKSTDAP